MAYRSRSARPWAGFSLSVEGVQAGARWGCLSQVSCNSHIQSSHACARYISAAHLDLTELRSLNVSGAWHSR
jgi:hypothetical protein